MSDYLPCMLFLFCWFSIFASKKPLSGFCFSVCHTKNSRIQYGGYHDDDGGFQSGHDTSDVNDTPSILKDSIDYLKSEGYVFQNFYDLL